MSATILLLPMKHPSQDTGVHAARKHLFSLQVYPHVHSSLVPALRECALSRTLGGIPTWLSCEYRRRGSTQSYWPSWMFQNVEGSGPCRLGRDGCNAPSWLVASCQGPLANWLGGLEEQPCLSQRIYIPKAPCGFQVCRGTLRTFHIMTLGSMYIP